MNKVNKVDFKSGTRRKKRKKVNMKSIDYLLLCALLLLLFIGIVMVYSSSSYYALYQKDVYNSEFYFKKEIIWSIVGVIGMIITMSIDYHKYKKIT